ncbi:sugar ABC transporter ATP-binding protein [Microcella pacifica]|uniref:Sugar ABC transporter ATP-binding protein n=1 Tax=Microcella pacifica TaxID=2591847 RepID=A0A9E5MI74_9MICO|nr:sugar ABC transporter ATP-binding protein [Microcella pacifica]NHF62403.1 sugar ABC transporter ATP-binding protein [Microcella pacifica]
MVEAVAPAVEMVGMSLRFPGVHALDHVDFTLRSGEVHALMGENGAGKSTLIKVLTGAYPADDGELRVQGARRDFSSIAEAQAAGISAVYQDVDLCGNLSIAENVMLGNEVRSWRGIDWRRTRERAHATLSELGLSSLDLRTRLSDLSPAVQQLVAIGRATVVHPRVLVLDEPTSSLDDREVAMLFAVIRRLRDSGVAILFVSHFLEQVFAISDRMTILRNGRNVGVHPTHALDRAEVISIMMGKDLSTLRRLGSERVVHRREPAGLPVLRAEDLGRRGVFEPTKLELHRGEVVGFAGLRGSGRTELARLLTGVDRADSGETWIRDEPVVISTPRTALRHRIAFTAENRREEGVIGELSVRKNITLSLQALRGWTRPLSRRERDDIVERFIEELGIVPADPSVLVKNLSGGNQQKVLLARWLAVRPRVLVLDEPTRGMDISAKVDIQAHVAQLAAEGVSIVFISSEFEEVLRLSDRIVVVKDRRKIGEISNGPGLSVDSIVELIAADAGED